ncbi:MAG: hypothetical protein K8R79_07715 [Calditrichales bacterium]|nr:hypothetical protein [Calditrichales bacterium]
MSVTCYKEVVTETAPLNSVTRNSTTRKPGIGHRRLLVAELSGAVSATF